MNVENKRDDRKKKIREIAGGILCIAVLLFIVMQIMLPETGIGGMVNEGSMAVLFFGVGAVCAYAAIKKRKEDKSALVLGLCLAVLACVPGGWISGKVAADLIEGPKTIRLTSVTTEELNGLSGLISHHYYLCGRGEDGKQYRLEVSADEFYELENIHEIIVRCYLRTADFGIFVIVKMNCYGIFRDSFSICRHCTEILMKYQRKNYEWTI